MALTMIVSTMIPVKAEGKTMAGWSELLSTGDGTTTSAVLGIAMLANGRKYLASGVKTSDLKKGIDCATNLAVEKIKEKSKTIRNQEDIKKMFLISLFYSVAHTKYNNS